jgi:hypothetical protein
MALTVDVSVNKEELTELTVSLSLKNSSIVITVFPLFAGHAPLAEDKNRERTYLFFDRQDILLYTFCRYPFFNFRLKSEQKLMKSQFLNLFSYFFRHESFILLLKFC